MRYSLTIFLLNLIGLSASAEDRGVKRQSGSSRTSSNIIFLMLLVCTPVIWWGERQAVAQTASSPAARIAKANLQSVVTLVALDDHDQPLSLGSGFFTSTNGLVATNAHVIEGAAKVVLRWQGKSGTASRIAKFDPRFDVVILQTSFSATPAARLGDSDLVTVGEEVVALGSPYGLEGTVSTGIISGIRPMDGTKYLQITAPISPGSSGGPIFNANAVVVGIATAALSGGQNLNFALPANLLNQIPNSSLTFATAKHVLPDNAGTQNYRDLVFANNVIEEWWDGRLAGLTLSLQNKTTHTICNPKVLVVIKNYVGEILNYSLADLSDDRDKAGCVAAGLAKQFYVSASTKGYTVGPNLSTPYKKGSYEIRILDFKIKDAGGDTLDNLLKKP